MTVSKFCKKCGKMMWDVQPCKRFCDTCIKEKARHLVRSKTMDALEYEKARIRICQTMILKNGGCEACPLYSILEHKCGFAASAIQNPDIDTIKNNVDRVIKWAKDHPVNTRQSEFLKQFPDASVRDGTLDIRPCIIEKSVKCVALEGKDCDDCRREYWLAEVTGNE